MSLLALSSFLQGKVEHDLHVIGVTNRPTNFLKQIIDSRHPKSVSYCKTSEEQADAKVYLYPENSLACVVNCM